MQGVGMKKLLASVKIRKRVSGLPLKDGLKNDHVHVPANHLQSQLAMGIVIGSQLTGANSLDVLRRDEHGDTVVAPVDKEGVELLAPLHGDAVGDLQPPSETWFYVDGGN
jgi:hypothetical protein